MYFIKSLFRSPQVDLVPARLFSLQMCLSKRVQIWKMLTYYRHIYIAQLVFLYAEMCSHWTYLRLRGSFANHTPQLSISR